MKNKRASEKYYILISLILGLILIAIVFGWIFQEYFFGESEMDILRCKQSVIARHNLPQLEEIGGNWFSLKDNFPLECKTQIITINENNQDNAGKIIADAISACWAIYNQGEVSLFPKGHIFEDIRTSCFTCARIHFDSSIKTRFTGSDTIPILGEGSILLDTMPNGQTYYDYLIANNQNPFLKRQPKGTPEEDFRIVPEENGFWREDTSKIYYPTTIDSNNGDLHITLASWMIEKDLVVNSVFFYQKAQQILKELTNSDGDHDIQNDWGWTGDINAACSSWDGINI
jgi:hypothetical protein